MTCNLNSQVLWGLSHTDHKAVLTKASVSSPLPSDPRLGSLQASPLTSGSPQGPLMCSGGCTPSQGPSCRHLATRLGACVRTLTWQPQPQGWPCPQGPQHLSSTAPATQLTASGSQPCRILPWGPSVVPEAEMGSRRDPTLSPPHLVPTLSLPGPPLAPFPLRPAHGKEHWDLGHPSTPDALWLNR